MWLIQAVISFLVIFALGMLIRWIINKARKPKAGPPIYTAPPPPPPAGTASAIAPSRVSFCPNCGSKVVSGSAFCGNCGNKIG